MIYSKPLAPLWSKGARGDFEGYGMRSVTVSSKYQVVIPKTVRKALNLRPGQKMQVIEYEGRIELIPERDIKDLRGFLKGINTEFKREKDRV